MTYFVMRNDGGIDGPFSVEDLRARAVAGNLDEGALLEVVETKQRLSARSVPGLFDGLSSQESAPVDLGPSVPSMPLIGGSGAPEVGSPASQTSGPNTPPTSIPQSNLNRPPVQSAPPQGGYSAQPPRMAPPVEQPMGPGQMPPPGYANYPRYGEYGPEVSPTRNDKAYGWVMFVFAVLGVIGAGMGVMALLALHSFIMGVKQPLPSTVLLPLLIGRTLLLTLPSIFAGYYMTQGLRKAFMVAFVIQLVEVLYTVIYGILVNPISLVVVIVPGIFLIYISRRLFANFGPPLL